MSVHTFVAGFLEYRDDESFERAVGLLRELGFLVKVDGEYWFSVGRGMKRVGPPEADVVLEERQLRIPRDLYRNLAYELQELVVGADGFLVEASSDWFFTGSVYLDGEFTSYDLDQWAVESHLDGGDPPDMSDSASRWAFQDEVIEAFLDTKLLECMVKRSRA